MQIVSFLLFIEVRCGAGEKQCLQRTFWPRSTFKKDARTMIGGSRKVVLDRGGSSEAKCDERMVSEVARSES